jgi:hypothetical protein
MMRQIAVLAVLTIASGPSPAGDWRLFRHRDPGPGPGWTYYGLDSPTLTAPPCTGKGCGALPPITGRSAIPVPGPRVPVYGPIPGQLNVSDLYRGFPAYPGIGWYGTISPSPRPRVTTVNVSPQ